MNAHPIPHRRIGDSISERNADMQDSASLLANAVGLIDRLGLTILAIDADRSRNRSIQVQAGPACASLDGVLAASSGGYNHYCANRFGCEIRWVESSLEAA